ncbi:MAG: acetate--CoA ligase family protein, partial [Candidatus Methanofastidiosia archaeon]
ALSYQQAFDWAGALATQRLPEGENVVIITNGGGVGVMAADSSEDYGVKLLNDYSLLDETFKPHIPPFGSTRNPIDITGQATDETLIATLKAALERREIHAVVVIYTESATSDFKKLSKEIIELSKKTHEKPLIFCFVGSKKCQLAIDLLNEAGLAAYSEPERAISALSILFEYKRFLERERPSEDFELKIDFENIKRIIKRVRDDGRLQLLENESKEILRMAGFEVPKFGVGNSIRECKELASEIGFPVVMKIVSEDILHKSDVGGVKVGIDSLSDVEKAYKEMVRGVKGKYPDANIRGIIVCEMVREGLEIILGLSRDPTFGPVLMFGLGGIYVEILGDVTFRIAPLSLKDAKEMVHEIKTSPLLYGARGQKRADIEKLTENIYRLSKLVLNLEDLVEMDINPLMVLEKGKGCKVVDTRMTLKPT